MKYTVLIILGLMIVFLAAAKGYASTPGNVTDGPTPRTEMVRMAGGTFSMGSPVTEASRETDEGQRRVSVRSFLLGQYEVSQQEYARVVGENPSSFKGNDLPVENVSWFEAVRYCNARSVLEGLTPAYTLTNTENGILVTWNRNADGYRLPTEAEWEYACRGGTATPFHTGANITTDEANYYGTYPYLDAPRGTYRSRTVPVGSFAPNAFGLYDMHGNVWEWCWDWYGDYAGDELDNPDGPASGSFRVNRGGGWNDFGRHLRSAYRAAHTPANRTFNLGFRIARNAQ